MLACVKIHWNIYQSLLASTMFGSQTESWVYNIDLTGLDKAIQRIVLKQDKVEEKLKFIQLAGLT